MLRFLLKRVSRAIIVVAGILVVNFLLLHAAPGDAVGVLAGQGGGADPAYLDRLRETYGLNQPLAVQFIKYAMGLLKFDLGWSFRSGTSVADLILGRLPATITLVVSALGIAMIVGVFLGSAAARKPNSLLDNAVSAVSLIAYSTPMFWLGLMLVVLFSINLGWLPTGGFQTVGRDLSGFAAIGDMARHAILPVLTLSFFYAGIYARLVRASILEVSSLDFVRTARAKGLTERTVRYRHVLRNALLPVVTVAGVQLGSLLGGSVVVEMVFNWPGLGRLAFEAIMARDLNVLLGILFLSSILVVLINILMDILYVILDPRIQKS